MSTLLGKIRGLIFLIVFIIIALSITIVLSLIFLLPFKLKFSFATLYSYANLASLKWICGLDYEIIGLENIPKNTSAVVMGNHQSTWETILCPLLFQPNTWVLKRELMWFPIFGWGLAALQPIALRRNDGRKAVDQLLEQGVNLLHKYKRKIIIFPEGTRVAVNKTAKYKIGGALLAQKAKVIVIPFAHNAGYFWRKHGLIKTPGKIKLVIGKPITTEGKTASQILRETETWIRKTQIEIGGSNN